MLYIFNFISFPISVVIVSNLKLYKKMLAIEIKLKIYIYNY